MLILDKIGKGIAILLSLLIASVTLLALFIYYKGFVYRSRYNRPVYTFLPPIKQEYNTCPLCKSYDGGIYGKGPLEQLRSETAKRCVHNWQAITKDAFVKGIKQDFSIDLAKDGIPFWKTTSNETNE